MSEGNIQMFHQDWNRNTITGMKMREYSTSHDVTFKTCDLNFLRAHIKIPQKNQKLKVLVIHFSCSGTSCYLRNKESPKDKKLFSIQQIHGSTCWHNDKSWWTKRVFVLRSFTPSLTAKSLTFETSSTRTIHHFHSTRRNSSFVTLHLN